MLAAGAGAGLPLRARLWLAAAAVAAYVPLAGAGPSVQRAGVMGVAGLVAALASRPASRAYALLLAAAVTLALNPRAAEDPGWQLSFAAVLAIAALAPRLRTRLAQRLNGRRGQRPPERSIVAAAADAAAVTVAATIGTAPLIALHFGRLSLVAVPANLAAAALVAPVMWLGVLVAAAGQLSTGLAAVLAAPLGPPLALLAAIAHTAAGVPHAEVGVEALPRQALELVRPPPGPPRGLVVSALDVGQGDATLVQHGARAILVDAGPPGGPVVRRLRDAGARRLDALVVTHAQADHAGGAAAVLAALPVGLVLDGRDGVRSADGTRLAAAARRRGVRLITARAGQELRAGPLLLRVLSPPAEPAAAHRGADPNARAVVAEVRDGPFSLLLTADAESDVTSGLGLGPVDVLKVAHHGSADPGLPGLLARLRPSVALIEVGAANRYGHPAPSTLAALRAVPLTLRTDRDGTVRVRPAANGLAVDRHA